MTHDLTILNPPLAILGKKITVSTLVQYGGKAVQIGLSVITIKLISNFLDESGYSVYAKITELALFFSVLGNLGIFGNLVRTMADAPSDGKVFSQAMLLRIVSALFFFVVSILILILTGSELTFVIGTTIFLGALFGDYITNVCDAMLQANYLMGRATAALIAGRIISTGLVLTVTRLLPSGGDINVALFLILGAILTGTLITTLISLILVRQKIKFYWSWDNQMIWSLLKLSLPFGLINISNNLYFRFLPDYFMSRTLTDSEFGTFNISFKIAQVVALASTFLMFSALPGLKQFIDAKHWQKAKSLTKKIVLILGLAALLLVVIGTVGGPTLIELLTHKKYFLESLWFMFPMMMLLAAISYGYDLVLIILFALNDEIWFLKMEILALAISLCFFFGAELLGNHNAEIVMILLGAIMAETVMVVAGFWKMRGHFTSKSADL